MPPARAFAAFTEGIRRVVAARDALAVAGCRHGVPHVGPRPAAPWRSAAPTDAGIAGAPSSRSTPGRSLRFTWHPGREPESAQWVEVVFEPAGAGTRATLTHGGWEALGEIAPILRREYAAGWNEVFGKLFAAYADRE